MSRDPLGRNGDTVRALAEVFASFTDERWREFGLVANATMSRPGWRTVTHAIADSRCSPPMVNALETAGIRAASRAISLPEEYFGGLYQHSAACDYPGGAMFMVAISDQYPRWVTELALRPLADMGIDVEPFLPTPSPDDEPMPEQYRH